MEINGRWGVASFGTFLVGVQLGPVLSDLHLYAHYSLLPGATFVGEEPEEFRVPAPWLVTLEFALVLVWVLLVSFRWLGRV